MAQELVTFSDLYTSVMETLGIQTGDTVAKNKIKRMINEFYLNEVIPFKDYWIWLQKNTQVIHLAAYTTGTAAVTNGSATVTLSTAPTGRSFVGYKFSVAGDTQIYTVSAHTTSSTTVTLSTAFQETTNSAAVFKIWRDRIDLPISAKETVEIWHKDLNQPLDSIGPQGLRELEAREPKAEGYPQYYFTSDYFDPSTSGDDETESDRYRQTRIYPAINDENVILNVDYIQEAEPLDDDTDEPLMPMTDRIVLYYGACAAAYSILNRNEEMHDKYWAKAMNKLSRMAGKREEGFDTPKLRPNPSYFNRIRFSGLRRRRGRN
jgi:hypothetical protein